MDEKVDVIAHIQAAPGEDATVREAWKSFVAPTGAEEGCLRYDLFQDIADSTKFTFIEEWANLAVLKTHSLSDHIAAGRAKMEGKLAGPSWVQVTKRIL